MHTYAVLGRGLLLYNGLDRDAMKANAADRRRDRPVLPGPDLGARAAPALEPVGPALRRGGHAGGDHAGPGHRGPRRGAGPHRSPPRCATSTATRSGRSSWPCRSPARNPFTQQGTTDNNGVATFTYTGANLGHDTLVARAGAISRTSATAHWNAGPTADAGPDQLGGHRRVDHARRQRVERPEPGRRVDLRLDGRLAGPPVTLTTRTRARPRFTPTLAAGVHVFELTVSDGRLSDTDTVTVTAELRNAPPVAADQSVATDEDMPVDDHPGSGATRTTITLPFTLLSAPTHGTLTGTGLQPHVHAHGELPRAPRRLHVPGERRHLSTQTWPR